MPDTRERIIAASSALFMQRGYAGSGLKQIATASEATIGSLYHFFPGGKGGAGGRDPADARAPPTRPSSRRSSTAPPTW